MKYVVYSFFLLICSTVLATDTILFLDTNSNELEIERAKRAAIKAGKKFVSYPKKGAEFNKEKAKEYVSSTKFSTLIISGHNGGGSFSGEDGGEISYTDIKEALESNKQSVANTRTLMLLGCNTSNPGQILNWKDIFPNLDIIAGYDGTGPNQNTISGLKYIEEIILNASKLLEQDTEEDLKRALRSIPYIYNLEAGIYLKHITCNEDNEAREKEYVFRPLTSGSSEQIKYLDFSECPKKVEELKSNIMPKYLKYFNGSLEIGSTASATELREVYNFFHQGAFCFEEREFKLEDGSYFYPPEWQKVLSLRFWNETQHNISMFYKDDLIKAINFIKNLEKNTKPLEKTVKKQIESKKKKLEYLLKIKKDSTFQLKELAELLRRSKEANLFYKAFYDKDSEYKGKILDELSHFFRGERWSYFSEFAYDFEGQIEIEEIEKRMNLVLNDSRVSDDAKKNLRPLIKSYVELLKKEERYSHLEGIDIELLENTLTGIKGKNDEFINKSIDKRIAEIKNDISEREALLSNDFEEFKEKVKELPISKLDPNQFSRLSRGEVEQLAHKFSAISNTLSNHSISNAETDYLEYIKDFVQNVSWELESYYIPFSWHEKRDKIEVPSDNGGTHETEIHSIKSYNINKFIEEAEEYDYVSEDRVLYHVLESTNYPTRN